MSVEKQGFGMWVRRGWFWLPVLMALYLCATMFRGGGAMYWGPLESDLTNQFYPWRVFIHRWIMRGVMPFWDPHIFSGYPSVETQQMMALNPVHLLTLWMPPNIGLAVAMAAHTLIAALGMAWGLRKWGRCTLIGSAVGAGVFTFGGLFSVRVMAGHFTVIAAMAWWPLAALSVLRIARLVPANVRRGTGGTLARRLTANNFALIKVAAASARLRRMVALSALFHAMVCLAGGPQYIVYLFYIDVVIIAAVARRGALFTGLSACAASWIIALLISAPQWLPALWYLPYTGRALSSGGSTGWSTGPLTNIALETLLPFPFGNDLTHAHLHFKNVWETALYPGALALALSSSVLLRVSGWAGLRLTRSQRHFLQISPLSLAGVCVFMAGFYMMLGGWLPGFGGFREPTKARALLAFAFALMSAAGATNIARLRLWPWLSFAGGLVIISGLAGLAMLSIDTTGFKNIITSFGIPFDPLAQAGYQDFLENPGPAYLRYKQACIHVMMITGMVPLLLMAVWFIMRIPVPVVGTLALILLLDVFGTHAPAWEARYNWSRIGLPQSVAGYFAPRLARREQQGELPWRVILDSGIINRTHHMEGLYEFHGYDPLMPAFAVGRMLVNGATDMPDDDRTQTRIALMKRVGVRYDMGQNSGGVITSASQVIVSPDATLYMVSRNVRAGSPGSNLFGPDLNGTSYVLPSDLAGRIDVPPQVPSKFQSLVSETFPPGGEPGILPGESISPLDTGRPDEWGVQVKLGRPALVTYKGTWLPGWTYSIDGENRGRALFANNWMCAAIVPAGQHEVIFRYRPVAWGPSIGICIAGVALGLVVFGAGVWPRRSRRGN